MPSIKILFLRLIIAFLVSLLIAKFFFSPPTLSKIFLLFITLFGFAYLFEYTKKRDEGKKCDE